MFREFFSHFQVNKYFEINLIKEFLSKKILIYNILKSYFTSHRKRLRKMLNIKWPKHITNEDLYSKTKEKPWSNIIAEKKIRWLGHALRLPEKMALFKSARHVERHNFYIHQK